MKLKEKFIKCRSKYDEYYILPVIDDAEQLVKVAEEFAIGFAEWYLKKSEKYDSYLKLKNDTKELLEIYKNESNTRI